MVMSSEIILETMKCFWRNFYIKFIQKLLEKDESTTKIVNFIVQEKMFLMTTWVFIGGFGKSQLSRTIPRHFS